MKNNKERLYIAYGSNLNLEQMKYRCPTAEVVGVSALRGWQLRFRGGTHSAVATVEPRKGGTVPVLIWRLQPRDELSLDHYEGFPVLYRKETLRITVNGKRVRAMIYIMNEEGRPYASPSVHYLSIIRDGYKSAGFDTNILQKAFERRKGEAQMNETVKEQIMAVRDTGEANMLDSYMVQTIANRENFYELVVYLEEHNQEYINFILTGDSGEGHSSE